MTAQAFQLRCECGESHRVVPRQAGETLVCRCGQAIEIPTLRAMRQLPPAASVREAPRHSWSRLQGSLFVGGLVVTLLAAATVANFTWKRSQLTTDPLKVEDFEFVRNIMYFTPTETWEAWTKVFRDQELGARNKPIHEVSREISRRYLGVIIAGSVSLVLGLAALVGSFVLRK